jgi:anthranilate synthase component 2
LILVVDNFDSFTYNLVDYFKQLELQVDIVRNNAPLESLCSDQYDAVVLSPGPGIPVKAGNLMDVVSYYHDKKPVLGICLGHQAIVEFFDGEIAKASKPMHGKISSISHSNDFIFGDVPETFDVVRYHSLICSKLPNQLEIIAHSGSGEIMALKHKQLPVYGLQFHPEAVLTQYGLKLLRNWKNLNSISN